MIFTLDARHEEQIRREVELGNFAGPNEVVAHALDRMAENESWSEADKAELNARLDEGMAQIERGEGIPGEQVEAELAAWFARKR